MIEVYTVFDSARGEIRTISMPRIVERWRNMATRVYNQSPFGVTEGGHHDFRSVPLVGQRLSDLTVEGGDFSRANFERARLEGCRFVNCIFDKAIFVNTTVVQGEFANCQLRELDLRFAHIGYGGTRIIECVIEGPKLSRAGFGNVIFEKCSLRGEDWKDVSFNGSGFWDCRFSGVVRGVTFAGRHPLKLSEDKYGLPQRSGLHSVDFTEAELSLTEVREHCDLENITLPKTGSAFICRTNDLINIDRDKWLSPDERGIISKYLKFRASIFRLQKLTIVSRHDLFNDLREPARSASDGTRESNLFESIKRRLAIAA